LESGERRGEKYCEAELYRLKGTLTLEGLTRKTCKKPRLF
jgi:hypothetical protein